MLYHVSSEKNSQKRARILVLYGLNQYSFSTNYNYTILDFLTVNGELLTFDFVIPCPFKYHALVCENNARDNGSTVKLHDKPFV